MPFVPLVAMGSIVFCLVNLLKNASHAIWSPVVTQLIAWLSGVLVVALFAHTNWADTLAFGDKALSQMNGWSQFVIGLMASSLLGVVTELKKAIDTTDSATKPPLLNDTTVTTRNG